MKSRTILILFISVFLSSPFAAFGKESGDELTYGDIEEGIIYADFKFMNDLVPYLQQLISSTPKENPDNVISLNEALGFTYLHLGNKNKSKETFEENLELAQDFHPQDKDLLYRTILGIILSSTDLLTEYHRFIDYMDDRSSSVYYRIFYGLHAGFVQDYEEAIDTFLQTMEQCDEHAANSKKWARILSMTLKEQIVRLYIESGEYNKALECLKDYQEQIRQSHGYYTYYDVALELKKSKVYRLLGNYELARQSVAAAEEFLAKREASETTLHAIALDQTGDIFFAESDFASAYDFYTKSEHISDKIPQEIIPLQIKELNCLYKMRNDEQAEILDDKIDTWLDNNKNIDYFTDYIYVSGENLANSIMNSLAIDILKSGLDLVQAVSRDYDNLLKLQNALGNAYFHSGDYSSAVNLYTEIIKNERDRAHDLFAFLPEGQRELYWKNRESLMNNIFMLNREGSITISRGTVFEDKKNNRNLSSALLYDASLLNKGLLLEAFLNMHRTIMSSEDQELIDAFAELRKLKGKDPEKSETLEKIIQSKISTYGDYMDFTEITWQDVRDNLLSTEIAIEFIVSEEDNVEYYSAEVLRSGYSSPQHVFLFARKKEDQSFSGMKPYESTSLYNKIWGKLKNHLNGCTDIYFSPAGTLYSIALEHLPVNDSTYFNDLYSVHRLSSTKSVAKRNSTYSPKTLKSAALYGGLDYNLDGESMEYYAHTIQDYNYGNNYRSLSNSTTIDNINWKYLYGTEKEVNNIYSILLKNSCKTSVYTGGEGIEESFKILNGRSPGIVHIATHGFYFDKHPDMLSGTGLVFSGANNYNATISSEDKIIEDGLLTSKEISEMDMNGTELVVLSACQTGLGKVSQEGVFGLQRGFKKACAKTLLMSLWEVEDEATNQLMTTFYSYLATGADKHQALRQAQSHVKENCGEDPHLWAGFILLD